MSNSTISQMTSAQLRMARVGLEMGLKELAGLTQIRPEDIAKLENGEIGFCPTYQTRLRRVFETRGVIFVSEKDGSVGVVLTTAPFSQSNVIQLDPKPSVRRR